MKFKNNKTIVSRTVFIIFFIANTFNASSQNFNRTAHIQPVLTEGYYKIFLSPEITSQLNHSFPDIRIYDNHNNEIQYILQKEKTVYDKNKRISLKILKNKHKKYKHHTELIVQNNENYHISNLTFKIVNNHNPVYLKIYGSDNEKDWYVIKNNFPAVPKISDSDSTEIPILDIPESSFNFYKLLFYDYDEEPIEITHVYFHDLANVRAEYVQLNSPKISQTDTLSKSIITLEFKSPQFVDMISFGIEGPVYYLRKVKMIKKDTSSVPHTGEEYFDQFKKEFYIGSLKSNRINLWDYKAKKIEFVVENKDNQSLIFYKANAYQIKNYIVTYLKPDETYTIKFGSVEANFPSYDLPYFQDTIPVVLPEAYIDNIQINKDNNTKIKPIWNFSVKYLWYPIGAIVLILILISIKLIREKFVNNKKTE
jgi:hypothetical protein